jgi:quinolinate synthase
VATEIGILHRLRRENPEKTFVPACSWCDCAHMKVNSLEKLLWSLEDMEYPVTVPEPTLGRARRAIDRMMEISGKR